MERMQLMKKKKHRHITSVQVIILGFLSVILLGTLLLMLPPAAGQKPRTLYGRTLHLNLRCMRDRPGASRYRHLPGQLWTGVLFCS